MGFNSGFKGLSIAYIKNMRTWTLKQTIPIGISIFYSVDDRCQMYSTFKTAKNTVNKSCSSSIHNYTLTTLFYYSFITNK